MSHELTLRANGKTEMAWVGDTPWHGLGQELQEGAPIEQWVVAAGMDWKVARSRVRFGEGPNQRVWDDQHVLSRSDTKAPLGIVSPGYHIVQPREVLEFFRELVDLGGYTLHTAGTMFGGKRYWALAKVADGEVGAGDRVGGFVLLTTTSDGSGSTEVFRTSVRVVCNNTLTEARSRDSKNAFSVTHRSKFNGQSIREKLLAAHDEHERFLERARILAGKAVSNAQAATFVRELLRPGEAAELAKKAAAIVAEGKSDFTRLLTGTAVLPDVIAEKRAPKGEAAILELFAGAAKGSNLPGVRGTAWGLVNAVTEYVDHKATAKSIDHRLESAFFGSGADLKARAFEMAASL